MKKRIITVIFITCLAMYVAGCGTKTKESTSNSAEIAVPAENSEDNNSDVESTVSQEPISDNSMEAGNESVAKVSAATEVDMVSLPEGIKGVKAEATPNTDLQQLIIDYYEIPEDSYETTQYYYNYVDLNGDGVNEIFVVVMGPYTSGTGGSSALWVVESAGELHVNQDFTLVHTPVIISDTVTNGVNDLIIPYYGGGAESQYSVLSCSDGLYPRVSDGKLIDNLDGITGTAIIANDMVKEFEAGIMGFNLLSQ